MVAGLPCAEHSANVGPGDGLAGLARQPESTALTNSHGTCSHVPRTSLFAPPPEGRTRADDRDRLWASSPELPCRVPQSFDLMQRASYGANF